MTARKVLLTFAMAMAAMACGGSSEDAPPPITTGGDVGTTPGFNYVPLNENVCELPDDDLGRLSVSKKLSSLGTSYRTAVATGLSLCPIDTCPENKLAEALASATGPMTLGDDSVAPPLIDHFNSALTFPYRELLVSWKPDAAGDFAIVLSQGLQVGRPEAHTYDVQPESLAAGCAEFDVTLDSIVEQGADDMATATSLPSSRPFGFIIPASLPETEGKSDQEIGAELDGASGIRVKVEEAILKFTVDENGEGTGTMTGYIQAASLQALDTAGVDLTKFAENGRIQTTLSFTLQQADVVSAIPADLHQIAPVDTTEPAGKPGAEDRGTQESPLSEAELAKYKLDGKIDVTCDNCKASLGTQTIGTGKNRRDVPRQAILVRGETANIQLKTADPAYYVDVRYDGILASGASLNLAPGFTPKSATKTYTFTRKWRKGAQRMSARPACVKQIADDKQFGPFDYMWEAAGWLKIPLVPIHVTDPRKGVTRSIWICQDFSVGKADEAEGTGLSEAQLCGDNAKLAASGDCECNAGFVRAFDQCVDQASLGCAAGAKVAKDKSGAVLCVCPEGQVGNGKTCTANPCEDNGACADGELCTVAADFTAKCTAGEDAAEDVYTDDPAKVNEAYASETDAKADGADGDSGEVDLSSSVGDDEELDEQEPASAPGKKPTYRSVKRPDLTIVRALHFVGKKTAKLAKDTSRTINGQKMKAAASVTKGKMRKIRVSLTAFKWAANYTLAVSAANWTTMCKTKPLGRRAKVHLTRYSYHVKRGLRHVAQRHNATMIVKKIACGKKAVQKNLIVDGTLIPKYYLVTIALVDAKVTRVKKGAKADETEEEDAESFSDVRSADGEGDLIDND